MFSYPAIMPLPEIVICANAIFGQIGGVCGVLWFIPAVVTLITLPMFTEILKLARRESHSQISKTTQCEQDALEMQVRASNMGMCSAHSYMKLFSSIYLFQLEQANR